jgi:hypothetical protein
MCALRIEDGELLGKRRWYHREWEVISPDEVRRVSEYWWPFPGLSIRTSAGSFRVRAGSRHFADIVEYIEACTPFDVRGSWLHGYIRLWYRRWGQARRKQDVAGDAACAPRERIPLRLAYPRLTISGIVTVACVAVLSSLRGAGERANWEFYAIMALGAAGITMLGLSMRAAASRKDAPRP